MRYFKVVLSAGDPISISGDELEAVMAGISKRSPAVVCKNGIFNSAFYVEIVVDKKKETQVLELMQTGTQDEEDSAIAKAITSFKGERLGDGMKKLTS